MKRPVKNTLAMKKLTVLLSVAILIVASLVIGFVARNTMHGPGPGQYAGSADNGSPPEVKQQTLPESPVERGTQLVPKGNVPVLQQGVTADQVTRDLEIGTATDIPAYDTTELTAKRGDVIRLRFKNDSDPKYHYLHSWVLTKPGKAGEVILQADRVGMQQDFIPKTDDVLAASKLIGAGESDIVMFRAPSEPGKYPFICTFPGHGQVMHGTLTIE
jgi:azurin